MKYINKLEEGGLYKQGLNICKIRQKGMFYFLHVLRLKYRQWSLIVTLRDVLYYFREGNVYDDPDRSLEFNIKINRWRV